MNEEEGKKIFYFTADVKIGQIRVDFSSLAAIALHLCWSIYIWEIDE